MNPIKLEKYTAFLLCAAFSAIYSNNYLSLGRLTSIFVAVNNTDEIASTQQTVYEPLKGSVRIITEPQDAVVYIDSIRKGRTPLLIDSLEAGRYGLIITKKGYYLFSDSIEVVGGLLREYSFILQRPACLIISTDPPGATVFLNGQKKGITPFKNTQLKPATYQLKIECESYKSLIDTIKVSSASSDSFHFVLNRFVSDSISSANKPIYQNKNYIGIIIAASVLSVFTIVTLIIDIVSS